MFTSNVQQKTVPIVNTVSGQLTTNAKRGEFTAHSLISILQTCPANAVIDNISIIGFDDLEVKVWYHVASTISPSGSAFRSAQARTALSDAAGSTVPSSVQNTAG